MALPPFSVSISNSQFSPSRDTLSAVDLLGFVLSASTDDLQRALLAQLAQRIHAHHQALGDDDNDGEGGTILLNNDDGCHVQ